ncbi:SOS response-associated peptidase [Pseudobdellovibrio sp. HCB154]|uniref:SOS response-associated peptidase n=1 Tax=Pseudobdellovibrio sp. HCB154 TaxID=3386277 RepID=UPI003916E606
MCAQFSLQIAAEELRNLGIAVSSSLEAIDERFLPYTKIPVIVQTPQGLKLTPMNFSLVPAWSKEPKVKFATHNARIETVTEKPAWREPFLSKHCLIPITNFFESVYEGPHAGHIISFQSEKPMLFAAGLFDVWVNPETKELLFSCAILTTEPSPFILENGHDRTPIFLNLEDGKGWLTLRASEKEMVDFLLAKNIYPDLQVTRDRPLKSGWEKRK